MSERERPTQGAAAGRPAATAVVGEPMDRAAAGLRGAAAGEPRSIAGQPPDPSLRPWRLFLEAHARVSRRLDEELRAEHGISLAEYDALVQLVQVPGHRLRMNQLADRVLLSRSGVTRLIDRLVADGLVTRSACSTDARGAEAVLTDAGLQRLRTAWPTHLAGIRRYFLESIATADLEPLSRSMSAVAHGACHGDTAAACDVHGGERRTVD